MILGKIQKLVKQEVFANKNPNYKQISIDERKKCVFEIIFEEFPLSDKVDAACFKYQAQLFAWYMEKLLEKQPTQIQKFVEIIENLSVNLAEIQMDAINNKLEEFLNLKKKKTTLTWKRKEIRYFTELKVEHDFKTKALEKMKKSKGYIRHKNKKEQ